jgi:hypothetical protein
MNMNRTVNYYPGYPAPTASALVLHDEWHPSVHQEAEELLNKAGIMSTVDDGRGFPSLDQDSNR